MKKILTFCVACLITLVSFSQSFKSGSKVDINWSNSWYKGTVLEVKNGKYKVHYDGWSSSWDEWVEADRLRNPNATGTTKETTTSTNTSTTTSSTTTNTNTTNIPAGSNPKAGKWEATVTNGYKGDKLTFTVSADGKRIENVEFTGYWQNKRRTIEILKNLDPIEPYTVTKGNFSAIQQEPKAGMWWEFTGTFTSPTTAEGTYRCAFAGGENDTYKLKWTAKRIGG